MHHLLFKACFHRVPWPRFCSMWFSLHLSMEAHHLFFNKTKPNQKQNYLAALEELRALYLIHLCHYVRLA